MKWKPEVQAVWEKLESFQLDENNAVFDFSARLSKENGWTRGQTARVVQEYKRFLLLAKFAGHSVTPSEAVDQTWHLHLVYTRSYWQELCGGILGHPLHHEPTAGSGDEQAKFEDQYQRTLESYQRLFGEAPPSDIWPPLQECFKPKSLRWFDASRHWLLPKPVWLKAIRPRQWLIPSTSLLAVMALASCNLNVFDWRGPDFLGFYVAAFLVSISASFYLVASKRHEKDRQIQETLTDRYEIAFLGGGGRRVTDAAMAALYGMDLMNVDASGKCTRLVPEEGHPAKPIHPMEERVLMALPTKRSISLREVRTALVPTMSAMQDRLAAAGLVFSESAFFNLRLRAAYPLIFLFLAGLFKVILGESRDKPIGFLVMMLIITMITLIIRLTTIGRRTPAGEALWRRLQKQRSSFKPAYGSDGRMVADPAQVALMVALAGYTATDLPGYGSLHSALKGPGTDSSSSSGCGSGGCGSGGCGGGGGCGGCGGGGGD